MEVLIMGAGMGGLFTGAILAKEGHRVTVLEKNAVMGGGLQNFVRHGESWETGMHVAGGFRPGDGLWQLCRYLGIMDCLKLRDADLAASIHDISSGKVIDIPVGSEAFEQALAEKFSSEAEGIKEYVKAVRRLSEEESLFYMKPGADESPAHSDEFLMPYDEFIASYVSDPALQRILAFERPMYAGVPGHTPAYLHAMTCTVFMRGPQYFEGGSLQLAKALASVIENGGGQVLCADGVSRIVMADGLVDHVETVSGKTYKADAYISDLHPCTMLKMIEGKAFPSFYSQRLESIPCTESAFKTFVKFKPGTVRYIAHPVYITGGTEWPYGLTFFMTPSADQPEYASHMTVLKTMSFDEVRKWENTRTGHRGEEYNTWKQERELDMMKLVESVLPGIGLNVEHIFSASPLTWRDWYGTKEGAMYGYMKDCQNLALSMLSVRTKVKNLLLTGQNVNMHGIGGVPMTAIETAESLLGRGTVTTHIIG